MTGPAHIKVLDDKDDILDALTHLGPSLFDQTVNTRERLEELAAKYSHHAHAIAIGSEGSPAALCAYYDNDKINNTAYLSMLVVDKQFQGKGYGTLLVREMTERCAEKGIERISLSVSKHNAKAIVFYESMGFTLYTQQNDDLVFQKVIDRKRGDPT